MKVRLDRLLVERGFFESGEKARRAVMAGTVTVDGRRADKAGKAVDAGCALAVAAPAPFVGRGGEKLDAALKTFRVPVSGRHCLDLGASTGGFTDCLLKAGATSVIAVDVGRGQLDRRLREDPRVVVRERTNARYLSREDLPRDAELVTVDLSFISLDKVLPAISRLIVGGGDLVALVKPQFEAGRSEVQRGGVVRNGRVHARVVWHACLAAERCGLEIMGIAESPLTGPAGNREFFIHARKP
ncbi:MAG: TlyA family RNA methyltransferase [Candidatus Aureabacteria bacterium]|nr:TlyA family RNA methyltransferase [Candidatus Auribacterota bacterium]NLW93885.1 TlyA family RNA methyltransferase [Chlamydiota bacterium]HOE27645.1 TlyA family RNA methyltransferase [bacterium]HQM53518.1 TlyA family RNA methyltransferase [bacterium]